MSRKDFDVRAELESINSMYKDSGSDNFSALVMGEFGSGKTRLLKTAVKPVLVFSFDPKGTVVLKDDIEKGEVFVIPFWDERSDKPTEYKKFETLFEKYLKEGFFEKFGTVAIDSGTTFLQALSNYISMAQGRTDGKLAIQDYLVIYNTVQDIIKLISARKTNFIFTAHLQPEQSELTGEIKYEIATYKQLKTRIPILFTEKYVLMDVTRKDKVNRYLLTAPYKEYRASTQLGKDGLFETREEPDISKLMKKAGYSTESNKEMIEEIKSIQENS